MLFEAGSPTMASLTLSPELWNVSSTSDELIVILAFFWSAKHPCVSKISLVSGIHGLDAVKGSFDGNGHRPIER
jgi:hypothetical protein